LNDKLNEIPTKPYLLRALFEWCVDNGYTPHLAGNERIEFSARFGGVARQLAVPIANVYALYARETGHGMTFDVDGAKAGLQSKAESEPVRESKLPSIKPPAQLPVPAATSPEPPKKPSGGKPTLRRIK